MGILIEKSNPNDAELFDEAYKEVDYINTTSQRFAYKTQSISSTAMKAGKKIEKQAEKKLGYCIRAGIEIPFDVEKPMSYNAWKDWSKKSDPDQPEKFCHFSGEPSNGETSYSKPILKKNWKKAKEIFNL
jgi:hypothetical protein